MLMLSLNKTSSELHDVSRLLLPSCTDLLALTCLRVCECMHMCMLGLP